MDCLEIHHLRVRNQYQPLAVNLSGDILDINTCNARKYIPVRCDWTYRGYPRWLQGWPRSQYLGCTWEWWMTAGFELWASTLTWMETKIEAAACEQHSVLCYEFHIWKSLLFQALRLCLSVGVYVSLWRKLTCSGRTLANAAVKPNPCWWWCQWYRSPSHGFATPSVTQFNGEQGYSKGNVATLTVPVSTPAKSLKFRLLLISLHYFTSAR